MSNEEIRRQQARQALQEANLHLVNVERTSERMRAAKAVQNVS